VIELHLNPSPLAVAEVEVLSDSDGDGIVEPGESASFDILLEDLCTDNCTDVSVHLSSELAWIIVEQPLATYPDFTPGDIYPGSVPFEVLVDASALPVFDIELTLQISANADVWNVPVPFSGGERQVYYTCQVAEEEPDWTIEAADSWEEQWHISQLDNSSPENSWRCGDVGWGDYDNHLDARLISPALELLPHSQLVIQHRMDAEVSSTFPDSAYDGGIVEVSLDDGETWDLLSPLAGYNKTFRWESGGGNPASHPFSGGTPCFSGSFDWQEDVFDLDPLGEQTVRFRFHFGSDNGGGDVGWFVDDITLRGYTGEEAVSAGPAALPTSPRLTAVYPNPFNATTQIELYLTRGNEVTLAIHDLLGRQVAIPLRGYLPAGEHSCCFDANGLATGVYFATLRVGGFPVDQQKLLLVK